MTASSEPRRALGVWDTVSVIAGVIIGATVFESPPDVFAGAGSALAGLAVWAGVGVLAFVGALCYAELASAYPTGGGDYTFFTRAFGRTAGFLFAWSELSVIRTGGSIAIMAYVFAGYAERLLVHAAGPGHPVAALSASVGVTVQTLLAGGSVLVLSAVNALGLRPGALVQNLLTAAKLLGLLGVVLAGFHLAYWTPPAEVAFAPAGHQTFALALVFVFYAYGGWNEAAYVAAEQRSGPGGVVRALLLGTGLVAAVYVLVNAAYVAGLGYGGVCRSDAPAGDVLSRALGPAGGVLMSGLVCVSALGAIHALLFTGGRLYSTFGRDHALFAWVANRPGGGPSVNAFWLQAGFSLLAIALIEFAPLWRPALGLGGLLEAQGERPGEGGNAGFRTLVMCTSPVFWLFFSMSGLALVALRDREPDVERPFRVPLFPLLPLLFSATSLWMLYQSVDWAVRNRPAEAVLVGGWMALGVPLYWLSERGQTRRGG